MRDLTAISLAFFVSNGGCVVHFIFACWRAVMTKDDEAEPLGALILITCEAFV